VAIVNGVLSLWINAFIPRNVPGSQPIPRGENAGKTAIGVPWYARAALNWGLSKEKGFLTDQRRFSALPDASVRTQSIVVIELNPPRLRMFDHNTSGTRQINFETGATEEYGEADMSHCTNSKIFEIDMLPLSPPNQDVFKTLTRLARFSTEQFDLDRLNLINHFFYKYGRVRLQANGRTSFLPGTLGDTYAVMINIDGQARDPLVRFSANIDYNVSFVVAVDGPNGRVYAS
jgi:hypothetical protein